MTDYAEWRDLEKEFRRFQTSYADLYAAWSTWADDWTNITRPPGEADRFDALCKLAATADGLTGPDVQKYWLDRVRLYLLARQSEHLSIEAHARRGVGKSPVGEPEAPEVERFEIHTIRPLSQACADYCLERSSRARNEERLKRIEPEKPIRRRQSTSEGLEEVRILARRMRLEGAAHKRICERLKDMPRPRRAEWRHLPWDKAYLNERFRSSVCKWLSANCRP